MPKYPSFKNPRLNRLADEHNLLHDFCEVADLVSYEAVGAKAGFPPEKYLIHYKVKSITAIGPDQMPVYGDTHTAEITIPARFPLAEQPKCKMVSQVWHPNIKFGGEFAGRICINAEALGHWHTLDMLAERIGEMLQYKNYHAENTHPHPEDATVAKWVREFAEPKGIINKKAKKYVDSRPLLSPSDEWVKSRKKKIEIQIGRITPAKDKASSEDYKKYYEIASEPKKRKVIVVKKKNN